MDRYTTLEVSPRRLSFTPKGVRKLLEKNQNQLGRSEVECGDRKAVHAGRKADQKGTVKKRHQKKRRWRSEDCLSAIIPREKESKRGEGANQTIMYNLKKNYKRRDVKAGELSIQLFGRYLGES